MNKMFKNFGFLLVGIILGITGALSFLRTSWIDYNPDFFFWSSIVTTILSFIFICISIWLYSQSDTPKEKIKAQVKIWMQDASGITNALEKIIMTKYGQDKFSKISDVFHSIETVKESASALYQSLYEERCVTEEEYKARQKRKADIIEQKELKKIQKD